MVTYKCNEKFCPSFDTFRFLISFYVPEFLNEQFPRNAQKMQVTVYHNRDGIVAAQFEELVASVENLLHIKSGDSDSAVSRKCDAEAVYDGNLSSQSRRPNA